MNRKSIFLLSDILEMLACEHDLEGGHIAGNGTGRIARPMINGVRVDLRHEDLECDIITVTVWDRHMILTEATIHDPFHGELVAEFVRSVIVRMGVDA